MCGINGFIQFKHHRNEREMYDLVHGMNEKIIHRGPDHEGMYVNEQCALGMRRLSIIDLQGGFQPIWNGNHTKTIIFNGEIYNYRELKDWLQNRGYKFKTNSDTEVVLLLYDECGIECFDKLEGMFALAIYDTETNEWLLARDRVGEKPLYYLSNENYFLFGSELKSLTHTGLLKKEIDIDSISTYFQLGYIPAPKTIFKNVFKLMPGTVLKIDWEGKIADHKFWTLKLQEDIELYQDYDKCKNELRKALFASVERCMISDVPLGAFLSGGFDSSIVVGIMSQISNQKVNTFNIGYKEKQYDESKLAKIVAKRNSTIHTELILDWDEVVKYIGIVLNNVDEPFADSSLIASYAVSKLTKKYVSVALTGDAGDELFAGYNKYLGNYYGTKYKKVPKLLRDKLIEPFAGILPKDKSITRKINKVINTAQMDDYDRIIWLMSLGFKPSELQQLIPGINTDTLGFIRKEFDKVLYSDTQTKMQYVDFCTVLEGDMLPKVDRASMLASLETRVPMLDRTVIELAFSMPTKYKISGKERKIILKETFRDLIPDELFSASKHGFEVPIGKWLSTYLKPQLQKYSSTDFLEEQGLFSIGYISQIMNEHITCKADHASELWTFFVFQNWYERVMAS